MSPSPKFWDGIAEGYARRPVPDEAAYQTKLETTQRYFEPDMEVLEIGCGTGTTALIHAPHVRHIRATDISPKMIEIARAKAADQDIDNVTFEALTVEDLAAPDATYDVVMAHSLLHLLKDKEAAIAKAWRLLKPGGVFVSSTVCLGEVWHFRLMVALAPIGRALGRLPYIAAFTADDLVASVEAAGFVIEHRWHPGPKKAMFLVAQKPA